MFYYSVSNIYDIGRYLNNNNKPEFKIKVYLNNIEALVNTLILLYYSYLDYTKQI